MMMIQTTTSLPKRVLSILWIILSNNVIFGRALSIPHQQQGGGGVSLVTGANGYVGREVIHVLLEEEIPQTIYSLVRPQRVEAELNYWKTRCSPDMHFVKVLPYNMMDGGTSFRQAMQHAYESQYQQHDGTNKVCVYHIASVFGPTVNPIQTAKENVQGTKELLEIMSEFPNCRLVLTSSMAAVRATGQDPQNGKYYTYHDWNAVSQLGENWGGCYQWSKAESERVAWELSKQQNVPMSSICPSFVFGPPSDPSQLSNSFSLTLVGQWVRGESPVQSRLCVDIRDVARAHVAAGTRPEAVGERFVVSTEARIPSRDMAKALKDVCRETGLGDPEMITYDDKFQGGAIPIGQREVEATDRLKHLLGITLLPVEETIADMGRALLQAGSNLDKLQQSK